MYRFSNFSKIFYITFLTFLIFIPIVPHASAGGQDATFDSIEVTAVPSLQGVGGQITIEVRANFFGGCCYYLYAYDVKAELTVPENVQLLGAQPDPIKSVDAEPGGQATSAKFKWLITSEIPGVYDLTVKVSTSNCGSISEVQQITFVEGASISDPTIFPTEPSINEDITFSAVVRSGNQFITIQRTTLYLWRSSDDYNREELMTKDDRIYKKVDTESTNDTDLKNNETLRSPVGIGTPYFMNKVQFTNSWRVQVNDIKKEEYFYYWYKVETSDGKNITSEVFKKQIIDYEQKSQLLSGTIWTTATVIIIGILLILILTWRYVDRTTKKNTSHGIYILGSTIFSKPLEGKKSNINVSYSATSRLRLAFMTILAIVMICLLAIAIYLGSFQDLITATGG